MDQSPVRHTPKLPFTFSPPIAPRGMHDYLSSTAHTAVAPRVQPTTKSGQLRDCVTDSKKRSRGDALRKNTYKPIDTPVFTKRDALHATLDPSCRSRETSSSASALDARDRLLVLLVQLAVLGLQVEICDAHAVVLLQDLRGVRQPLALCHAAIKSRMHANFDVGCNGI
mmetsp:Transcript_55273/g.132365  ORF Transcript_55273/g.132365 Transcript_55273/m.132365 type:complete len:169 (-) Transcript_55273:1403-1909(-)